MISTKGSVTNSNDSMESLVSGSLLHHRTFQDSAQQQQQAKQGE